MAGATPPIPHLGDIGLYSQNGSMRESYPSDPDEELIPTAIVIKNIPFAVKKEQLVQLMTDMRLPLPYAFNYHFDNGVFRGLAFANFTTPEETGIVIEHLNQIELHGRKLRVEYKKMLPAAERERIEREKRERRGQLQEQHEPAQRMGPPLQQQTSTSSLASGRFIQPTPSPSASRQDLKLAISQGGFPPAANGVPDYDLNDPTVLEFYSQLLLFKKDLSQDSMTFPATLTPMERRTVHTLAHHMNLAHVAKGENEQRQLHVFRVREAVSPPIQQLSDPHRRGLNRAATTDFSDVRGQDGFNRALGHQSSGFLGLGSEPGGLAGPHNLRAAKSYADLRSYTPSPAQSTASFPANLNANASRFDLGLGSTTSTNPSLTPTATTRDESYLVNGLSGMSLGGGFGGNSGSPRGMRQLWEREAAPGPIGGHRSFSNMDEAGRDRVSALQASRQPRGPVPERGLGFGTQRRTNGHLGHHHQQRGSDDASSHSGVSGSGVEFVVEQAAA